MRVLSLGCGQQSTALYLMAANGHEGVAPFDYAIFADPGDEPSWVHDTLRELSDYRTPDGRPGAPILVRWLTDDAGARIRLSDQLLSTDEGRFATIPAYVKHLDLFDKNGNAQGKAKRQCTKEFKTSVIERTIRYELLGLKPGEAYTGPRVTQIIGFDFSESRRIVRVKDRFAHGVLSVGEFPLWDLQWRRADCVAYVKEILGHEILPSACVFCPLVSAKFRRQVRDHDPAGHRHACQVDHALRKPGSAASRMLRGELYVHRSMVPLEQADLGADPVGPVPAMFGDCEGLCGT